ncbi:MAG: toll/interleukin-1 receptor domain-containing protein [Lutibacter sp.]|nr:toll/interleukin-1 receptor domain-containing protein [Lutibacter sp.]
MATKKKIFLSYSRADLDYIATLVDALREKGADVWFDKNIRTGEQWDNTLEEQIKAADVFLIVMSKTSVASNNVKDEMSYAKSLGKIISPILIEPCEVPMRLARHQYVDFTQDFDWAVNKLMEDLDAAEVKIPGVATTQKTTSDGPRVPISPAFLKKPKAIWYVLSGAVGIILLFVVIGQCDSETGTETEVSAEQSDNPDWNKALNSHSIDAYLSYIYKFSDEDAYFGAALDSINSLMPNEGIVTFAQPIADVHFTKNLYTAMDGTVSYGQTDGELPKKGDILSAINAVQVYDVDDKQIINDEYILAGEKVRVLKVDVYEDSVWITIAYPER